MGASYRKSEWTGLLIAMLFLTLVAPGLDAMEIAVKNERQALSLDALSTPKGVELTVIGEADTAMTVEYELEVSGASRTHHAGKTKLKPGRRQLLSTVRFQAGGPWRAELTVVQENGVRYSLTREGSKTDH